LDSRNTSHAFASSGVAAWPSSASDSSARAPATLSAGDSAGAVTFIAATNKLVNSPPLKRVLRKNSHVCGQPLVPVISAVIQPQIVFAYSGFSNGLNSHEAVFVMM